MLAWPQGWDRWYCSEFLVCSYASLPGHLRSRLDAYKRRPNPLYPWSVAIRTQDSRCLWSCTNFMAIRILGMVHGRCLRLCDRTVTLMTVWRIALIFDVSALPIVYEYAPITHSALDFWNPSYRLSCSSLLVTFFISLSIPSDTPSPWGSQTLTSSHYTWTILDSIHPLSSIIKESHTDHGS